MLIKHLSKKKKEHSKISEQVPITLLSTLDSFELII